MLLATVTIHYLNYCQLNFIITVSVSTMNICLQLVSLVVREGRLVNHGSQETNCQWSRDMVPVLSLVVAALPVT